MPANKTLHKGSVATPLAAVTLLFGSNVAKSLQPLNTTVSIRGDDGATLPLLVSALVPAGEQTSVATVMRAANDRMFFSCNDRIIDNSALGRGLLSVFCVFAVVFRYQPTLVFGSRYRKHFNLKKRNPFIVCNLRCAPHACDVNLAPDKRRVLIVGQDQLLETLGSMVDELLQSSTTTPVVSNTSPHHHQQQQRSTTTSPTTTNAFDATMQSVSEEPRSPIRSPSPPQRAPLYRRPSVPLVPPVIDLTLSDNDDDDARDTVRHDYNALPIKQEIEDRHQSPVVGERNGNDTIVEEQRRQSITEHPTITTTAVSC
jgi:DNA mismatch repair ATPase MutL